MESYKLTICLPQWLVHINFWGRVSPQSWAFCLNLEWLLSKPQVSAHFHPSALVLHVWLPCPGFYCGCWGSKFSAFPLNHLPAPRVEFYSHIPLTAFIQDNTLSTRTTKPNQNSWKIECSTGNASLGLEIS